MSITLQTSIKPLHQTIKPPPRHSLISPNKHEAFTPLSTTSSHATTSSAANAAAGLVYDGKPNINDLRQMFDKTRHEHKRNYMHASVHSQQQPQHQHVADSGRHAFADARQSSLDENVFDARPHQAPPAAIAMATRNVDFERAKQKFDKPTSLRLNISSQHALHNQPPPLPMQQQPQLSSGSNQQQRQALGNFMRLGQSSGAAIASRRLVEAAAAKATSVGGGGGGGGGVGGLEDERYGNGSGNGNNRNGELVGGDREVGEYFQMTTSMNLDELKVSDEDVSMRS